MASRLAQDMGLNLDSVLLRSSANLSMEDVDLRRRVYWALYCDDKLAASYTGRVCTLMVESLLSLEFSVTLTSSWLFKCDCSFPGAGMDATSARRSPSWPKGT